MQTGIRDTINRLIYFELIFIDMDYPNLPVLQVMYYHERSEKEKDESDFSFEEIFHEELELLEEVDQVCQNKETVLNIYWCELNFKQLFLDELRFLENKQQPNFYISTINLGFEEIINEKLVVRKQIFTDQESKFNKKSNYITPTSHCCNNH